jgi:hypothetical protein
VSVTQIRVVGSDNPYLTPGCLGRTIELLCKSVILGGAGGRRFEEVLRALDVADP